MFGLLCVRVIYYGTDSYTHLLIMCLCFSIVSVCSLHRFKFHFVVVVWCNFGNKDTHKGNNKIREDSNSSSECFSITVK